MSTLCSFCPSPKGNLNCGICDKTICRKCAQFLEKHSFPLWEPKPAELLHEVYCAPCFIEKVAPAEALYEKTEGQARSVLVFYNSRGDESRPVKSSEKPLKVEGCIDRKEAMMRLAYLAAQKDFNALIDVNLAQKKIHNGGHQTSRWYGSGTPARVNREKFPDENRPR